MPWLKKHRILLMAISLIILTGSINAEVPQLINYQGRLTNPEGEPLDTTVSITFTIYDDSTGGVAKWSETYASVVVSDGLFYVLLGSVSPIIDSVFNNPERYLGIIVGTDPEMSPRTRFTSAAYAYNAESSHWNVSESMLYTNNNWSIVRGEAGNLLQGSDFNSVICMGTNSVLGNLAEAAYHTTISGGTENSSFGTYNTIGGGYNNSASRVGVTVGGGSNNDSYGYYNTISGGADNAVSGFYSTVAGGRNNDIDGSYSFAIGRRAKAEHTGTFVWADSTDADFTSTGNNQFLIRAAGGVGINNATPLGSLDIAQNSDEVCLYFSNGTRDIAWSPSHALQFGQWDGSDWDERMRIAPNGYIGVGETNPAFRIDCIGNIRCAILVETSDMRLKKNISSIDNALDKIGAIRGVSFEWNDQVEENSGNQLGVIAQEVESILPELVLTDNKGYKSVSYTKLTAVLIEAVKELKTQNEKLSQRITELEESDTSSR
ncbi:MAG: hypothetical protein GY841_02580 [FCB group bacterium]|nr:hypothetical protein [FCB group bacterium]